MLLGNKSHEPNENTLNKILMNQRQHCIKRKIHCDLNIFQESCLRFENQSMLFNIFIKEILYNILSSNKYRKIVHKINTNS